MCASTVKTIYQVLGWFGAMLFLIAYYQLIAKKWKSSSYVFHIFNLMGGILVGINAFNDRSYPAAFINIAWSLIALYGIYIDKWKKNARGFKHVPD